MVGGPTSTHPAAAPVKPGNYPYRINLQSRGKVPAAILTTDDFNAYDVDPVSCEVAGAYPLRRDIWDMDDDGGLDGGNVV